MSITLNGRTYNAEDFKGYGYVSRFPEQLFADLLAELAAQVGNVTAVTPAQRAAAGERIYISGVLDGEVFDSATLAAISALELLGWPRSAIRVEITVGAVVQIISADFMLSLSTIALAELVGIISAVGMASTSTISDTFLMLDASINTDPMLSDSTIDIATLIGMLAPDNITSVSTINDVAMVGLLAPSGMVSASSIGDAVIVSAGGITDDFNRANGVLTSPWSLPGGTYVGQTSHMPQITGNAINSLATYWSVAHYQTTTANNQFAQAIVSQIQGAGYAVGVRVRCQTASSWDCYYVTITNLTGTVNVTLAKLVTGSVTALSSYGTGALAVTTVAGFPMTVKLTAVGTTISAYINGVLVSQGTDSSLAAGYAGIWIDPTNTTAGILDDFTKGDL
jgi:hypothetical protein